MNDFLYHDVAFWDNGNIKSKRPKLGTGFYRTWRENGDPAWVNSMFNNKLHGTTKLYKNGDVIWKTEYIDGEIHGIDKQVNMKWGFVTISHHRFGKLHGTVTFIDLMKGEVLRCEYTHNNLISQERFDIAIQPTHENLMRIFIEEGVESF